MKLLHIDSSILGDQSASRQLTDEIVSRLLGFLGIDDIAVVRAEGLARGPAQREAAMQAALAAIAPPAQIAA